jgi:hypothetical protein
MTTVRMGRVLNGFNVSHVAGVQLEEVHTFLLSCSFVPPACPRLSLPQLSQHPPYISFNGTMSRDFLLLGFFHESVSPQPQSIPL